MTRTVTIDASEDLTCIGCGQYPIRGECIPCDDGRDSGFACNETCVDRAGGKRQQYGTDAAASEGGLSDE